VRGFGGVVSELDVYERYAQVQDCTLDGKNYESGAISIGRFV
jgi:hypothetical protein